MTSLLLRFVTSFVRDGNDDVILGDVSLRIYGNRLLFELCPEPYKSELGGLVNVTALVEKFMGTVLSFSRGVRLATGCFKYSSISADFGGFLADRGSTFLKLSSNLAEMISVPFNVLLLL